MSESITHDLDVLRPQPEYVLLGGKKIDISFIPSGIAMDMMALQDELAKLTSTPEKLKKVAAGGKVAGRTFEIAAELCAAITSSQYPEMDKDWLLKNTDVLQIKALMELVTTAAARSLDSAEDDEIKKPPATEGSP